MKELSTNEFFGKGKKALHELLSRQDALTLTENGKPVARIEPVITSPGENFPGKLKDTVIYEKDIVSPLGAEAWESTQ